jgi:DNA-binding CsgD family transcriptional regulator
MKIDPCIRKPWKIPKNLARLYSVEKIENALSFFNRACNGNFYMVDYYKQKLILGTSSASTFCGYPKDLIREEGFAFYKRILKKDELDWLAQMNEEAYNVFFDYPESERQDLEFIYELIAETKNQREIGLQHRLVPYKLCENGNMWLGLCFVSPSPILPTAYKASIVNFETGDTYNFIDGVFVRSDVKAFIPDEITILDCLAKDMQAKQICELLKISESVLMRRKQKIYGILDVHTSAGAVHKAHVLGVL